MANRLGKFVIAMIWMPISIGIAIPTLAIFTDFPILIFSDEIHDRFQIPIFHVRDGAVLVGIAVFSLFYFLSELKNLFRPSTSRLLIDFRYGPIAIGLVFSLALLAFDKGMISYSKYQISRYVYDSAESVAEPDLFLHNDDRGWCGNGLIANLNYTYFDTASTGLLDSDEYIRARSLLMANDVSNYFNGGDIRFDRALVAACEDESNVVRNVAEDLISRRGSASCASLTSSFPFALR